jgi:hypothetical protein
MHHTMVETSASPRAAVRAAPMSGADPASFSRNLAPLRSAVRT